jgi:hypothetical protein
MIMFILSLGVYGLAKYYAPSLVYFVVEHTLIEKAPPGTDPVLLRKQLHALISAAPDQNAKMEKLFHISGYLEKVKFLTLVQLYDVMEMPIPSSEIKSIFPKMFKKLELFSLSGCLI